MDAYEPRILADALEDPPASRPTTISAAPTSSISPAAASTRRRWSACRRAWRCSSTACGRTSPRRRRSTSTCCRWTTSAGRAARGNGSLLGRNSLGGAVNLVTARGHRPARGASRALGRQLRRRSGEARVAGSRRGGLGLVRRRRLQPRGRLARGHRRAGLQGLRQRRQAGRDQRHPLPGVLPGRQRRDRGLAARDPSSQRRPNPTSRVGDYENSGPLRARSGLRSSSGLGRGLGHGLLPPHRAERFNVNQAPDDNVRRISNNSTSAATADYRWTTLLGTTAALASGRRGRRGQPGRHPHLRRPDQVRRRTRTLTTEVRSPLWDVARFAAADSDRAR